MSLLSWLTGVDDRPLSSKKALKRLLKGRYSSIEEYDRYLTLIEEQTGHPDVEALISEARHRGLKTKELMQQVEADVALLEALVSKPHHH